MATERGGVILRLNARQPSVRFAKKTPSSFPPVATPSFFPRRSFFSPVAPPFQAARGGAPPEEERPGEEPPPCARPRRRSCPLRAPPPPARSRRPPPLLRRESSARRPPEEPPCRSTPGGGAAPLRSCPPPARSRRPLTGYAALGHGDPPLLQLYPDAAVHYQAAPRWATRPASTSPATTRINLARHDAVSEAARPCSELCCLFQCSSCAFCV